MIAKIGKGINIYGAVAYNQLKVDKEKGKVLLANKIPEPVDGNFKTAKICRTFEPYLLANNKTEKPVRHISLNPDPEDKVSDGRFIQMAEQYMREMGYADQPYIVYKHTDIERTHIHIVTICVQLDGSKIPDSYDHHRSMAACRSLEQQFDLKPANQKTQQNDTPFFKPVDYSRGDVKSQLASVIRHLPKHYSFPTLGTYNALLSLFNIATEQISGEAYGMKKKGLVYFALDTEGKKTGKPFKSSLFGRHAGLDHLQAHFEKSKIVMAKYPSKGILKNTIEVALYITAGENDFKKHLLGQGINVVTRRNTEGRVYGITFIDHDSKSVWNGSQLGKNLSATTFDSWWNKGIKVQTQSGHFEKQNPYKDHTTIPVGPFEFLDADQGKGLIEPLVGLLPDSQGEDYEEYLFENRMKKKRKRKGGHK